MVRNICFHIKYSLSDLWFRYVMEIRNLQTPCSWREALILIGLGFFDMFRFVDLSQRNFVQGLTIKALPQIWVKSA